MVLRWILPNEGGGSIRRYLRVRKEVWSRYLNNNDAHPAPPVSIFDFSNHDDAVDAANVHVLDKGAWRISDDRVIGGYSVATAKFIYSKDDYDRYRRGEEFTSSILTRNCQQPRIHPDTESQTSEQPSSFTSFNANNSSDDNIKDVEDESELINGIGRGPERLPFLRFIGTLNTDPGLGSTAQRSGFAALRSPIFPFDGANLHGLFEGLEIMCRSDGRVYTVNLKVSSAIPDDLYQGYLQTSTPSFDDDGHITGPFDVFILPFSAFRVTSMGRRRAVDRKLDSAIRIESVGVALMDGINGGFQFDLARIRAVNELNSEVFEHMPEDKIN